MSRLGKLWILSLALALTAGMSCTAGELPTENPTAITPSGNGAAPGDSTQPLTPDTSGVVPTDTATVQPADTTSGEPADTPVTSAFDVDLLTCEPQKYAAATQVIGPAGGQILLGGHKLTVLAGALTEEVPIVMEQVEGTVNSVRFSPEGLRFALPAILTLSYKNCPAVWHAKRIVYTDESLKVLEILPSLDFNKASQVKGLIYHFSRYAVAY